MIFLIHPEPHLSISNSVDCSLAIPGLPSHI